MGIGEGHPVELQHPNGRLIVTYSGKRAHNDRENREKGLKKARKACQKRETEERAHQQQGVQQVPQADR